jgi:DNA-binding MarR family transcriptional regulator
MNGDSLLIHQPTRLSIMAALSTREEGAKVDFTFLSEELEVTEGNLSSHIRKLEEAGLLNVEKVFVDRKPKTWIALTARGRQAFSRYVEELEKIVRGAGQGEL